MEYIQNMCQVGSTVYKKELQVETREREREMDKQRACPGGRWWKLNCSRLERKTVSLRESS